MEKNTLHFKFWARYSTVIYQEVSRKENYLSIVTYIRCCQDSNISAGIAELSVGLMPQSNLRLLLIYSRFVLHISLAFILSVWSLYLSCNLFFNLIFFMCVGSCLSSGFFPDLPICSLVMLSMKLLFLSSRIKSLSAPSYLGQFENIALMLASRSQDCQWFTRLKMRLKHCLDKAFTKRGNFKSVFHIPRLILKLKRDMENKTFFVLFGCYMTPEAYIYCQLAARW